MIKLHNWINNRVWPNIDDRWISELDMTYSEASQMSNSDEECIKYFNILINKIYEADKTRES